MKYAGLLLNDFCAAPGISVSFFVQGCPIHCPGCQNPESWDFDGGKEITNEVITQILEGLTAQGIKRNLCVMGGEPLCKQNLSLVAKLIKIVRRQLPDVEIYVWTGYEYSDLIKLNDSNLKYIFNNINCLVDGPYVKELRDITLFMRGSSNQNIRYFDF